ncbi:MAG: type 2 lanthipeptide synthetase LanM, partial [Candidatus Eremiobacterota bacterium]
GKKVRFVFRNTSDYWRVLQMLLKSESLRNGTEQTVQSGLLWRIFKDDTEKPYFFNLIDSERKSLLQGDVPYFSAYTDTTALELERETISSFFIEPSFDLVVKRLKKLDNSDMELQVSYIKNALYSRVAKDSHILSEPLPGLSFDHVKIFSEKSFLEKAIEIGEEIRKLAVIDRDKHITWIAPQYIEKIERYQLSPLGYELYGGTSGVALFMAALASVTGLEWCRTMALGAINLLRRELQEKNTDTSIPDNIGGTTGIGSLIYAFVSISRFLDEKELLLDAVKLAGLITKELVDRDTKYDVIAGSAGAILGLLSLHRILPDSPALSKALLCGKHLVENRKSWPSVEGNRMTGFSHGLAGIALSLLNLYSFTGEEAFLEGAVKAIEEENSLFDSENNNWPHFVKFPSMVKKGFWVTWCHGGPGIGLARLGGLSVYDTDQIRKDIDIALNITGKFLLSHIDHICCGNFGRNELLVAASKKFSDAHLLSKARSHASWIIEHRKEKGYFNLDMKFAGGAFNPGLFKGTSGIGYQLLRLIYPDRIPSLLLWE